MRLPSSFTAPSFLRSAFSLKKRGSGALLAPKSADGTKPAGFRFLVAPRGGRS